MKEEVPHSDLGRADWYPREKALASAEQMLRERVDHVGVPTSVGLWGTLWESGAERPRFQMGRQRPGAVQRPAQGAGSQGLGPRRPRLPADPPPWLPQLHHACTGPGLSLLCLLRHDILEYFSVYGTALSMWVSLMGEWPPPAARPCTGGVRMPHCPPSTQTGR